jgi:NADP-dependent 3-hydroxy acid dehydrogenase YdfG
VRELGEKVAVVTGAAGGIGAALARRLGEAGARLVLVDRPGTPLEALARELGGVARPMDVRDAAAWGELAGALARDHGGADLLVNNAGVTIHGTFLEHSLEDLDRIVDVNLKGVLLGCRALAPQLVARGAGHIVNVSSLAGRLAFPYQSTYSATKFAVRGFGAALRMELAAHGVGVTTVMPGTVATRLLETAPTYDAPASRRIAELMLAHGARPERVAERIVRAIVRDEAEVVIGWDARLATLAQSLAPRLVEGALARGFRARLRWTR